MIITKTGLWTTLLNSGNEGELEIRSTCDVCLILIGQGNTGYGEIVRITPNKSASKANNKRKSSEPVCV